MRTQRVRGLQDEVMRTQHRVRGLQDVGNCEKSGSQSRASIISRLAQLEAEKERISQQKSNWDEKSALIGARLAHLEQEGRRIRQLLVEGEQPEDEPNGRRRQSSRIADLQEAPFDELTTIRY